MEHVACKLFLHGTMASKDLAIILYPVCQDCVGYYWQVSQKIRSEIKFNRSQRIKLQGSGAQSILVID